MDKIQNFLFKNQALIYKVFLFVFTVSLMVYFFPEGKQFKFEIIKNKTWQHQALYAPYDFSILKSKEEINAEKKQIKDDFIPIFNFDESVAIKKIETAVNFYASFSQDSLNIEDQVLVNEFIENQTKSIYTYGIRDSLQTKSKKQLVYLKKGNIIQHTPFQRIKTKNQAIESIKNSMNEGEVEKFKSSIISFYEQFLTANVSYNELENKALLDQELAKISTSRGLVKKGELIIDQGQSIDAEKYQKLISLKEKYSSVNYSETNQLIVSLGQLILIAIAILILFLFIKQYRFNIYDNNKKLSFIIFNILVVFSLNLLVLRLDSSYVYVIPICILPITLKAFFDARLGLFTHVITVLILGFIVPNSYEYMFLQILAGIVTILSVPELYKRANLFISVGQITLVYLVSYVAFTMVQEGSIVEINQLNLLLFVLSGLGLLFVQPLIYSFEKIFGLVSDLSLLELSDTNNKLLKELSEKAPGTLHHSLNVANLAEASANEIGANSLLVRVGALYHDIGKMYDAFYFTENQTTAVNPHDDLPPQESAKIIIGHRMKGIEMAKKNKLPDRIIDFIRTHHGTTTVYYFYKKQLKLAPDNTDIEDFRYPGPKPFSKETAILMMCDSIEAASKSIKEPTGKIIEKFVDKIIDKQIEEKQFVNANITFKEIESIKKVLKQKLKNIYHLRIEYPE